MVVVLEEVDQEAHCATVGRLWEMAAAPELKLILVGTGNAPNFATLLGRPTDLLLEFSPYSSAELAQILQARLTPALASQLFEPNALRLLTEKVASEMGDMRTVLACVARAVELAEAQYLARTEDTAGMGRVGVRIMMNVFDHYKVANLSLSLFLFFSLSLTTCQGSKRTVATFGGLTPAARQLLEALVATQRVGQWTHSEIRRIYCAALHVERPDAGVVQALVGALVDAGFLTDLGGRNYALAKDKVHVVARK